MLFERYQRQMNPERQLLFPADQSLCQLFYKCTSVLFVFGLLVMMAGDKQQKHTFASATRQLPRGNQEEKEFASYQ